MFRDWVEVYGMPNRIHSDNDVRFTSEVGWWRNVFKALGTQVTFGIPYRPQSNALAERQNKALLAVLRTLMQQQKTGNWLKLLPIATWMLNNQYMPSLQTTPGELFLGRPYWKLFEEVTPTAAAPTVRSWITDQLQMAETARKLLQAHRAKAIAKYVDRSNNKAKYNVGDYVLIHKRRFPKWKRKKLASPWWGPFKVTEVLPGAVKVLASPKLGGIIRVGTSQHLKKYPLWDENYEQLWEEIADTTAAFEDEAAQTELEEEPVLTPDSRLPTPNLPTDRLIVDRILRHRYKHAWRFLTTYRGYPVSDATWETTDSFIVGKGLINPIFKEYCLQNNLGGVILQTERRAAVFGDKLATLV